MSRSCVGSLVLAVVIASTGIAQTPEWRLELLGSPPASWGGVWATAVNDAGHVIGNTYIAGWKHGWIAAPGQGVQLLPLPAGANYSDAFDINAAGTVVGQVLISGLSHAVVWQPTSGGYQPLLLPSGPGGHTPFDARGINDRGDVVGKYGILGGSYAWHPSTGITQLTTATFPSVPEDVNERRQVVGDSYRLDLDTMVLEDLGNPDNTPFNYVYTELICINDAGEAAGYSAVATSLPQFLQAVRYTDGAGWTVFNTMPALSASAFGLAATGDTAFQLGNNFGRFVYVDGFGSLTLQGTLAPAYADWDLTGSFNPTISRGSRLACTGINTTTGQSGVVLLTPSTFDDLGGAAAGALGTPVLGGYGALTAGQPVRLRLASAAPNSVAALAVSSSSNPVPLLGGIVHTNPADVIVALPTDALGRFELALTWPNVPLGTTFFLQAAAFDLEAMAGLSLSNGLRAVSQ